MVNTDMNLANMYQCDEPKGKIMRQQKWCSHFKWIQQTCRKGNWMLNQGWKNWAWNSWKFCPICGKKRP